MKILIPNNFLAERKYIIEILIDSFLGLKYELKFHDKKSYIFILENNNSITFQDAFFSKFIKNNNYLSVKNIPEKIIFSKNRFTIEDDIPIVFGEDKIDIEEDKIFCGIDIFASSFFMLSRWEEYVIKEKDEHGRFPEHLSLSKRENIYYRPIVNEYVEMLWNMLQFGGIEQQRKIKKYKATITHDIDFVLRYESFYNLLKEVGGDVIRRKNPLLIPKTIKSYINIRKNKQKDIYDTYNFLMDISEKHNLKSHFYFIPALKGEEDAQYNITDKRIKKIIINILKRGHIVGLHGTYKSYKNYDSFKSELDRLKNIYPEIIEGRQHYLRFAVPDTWQIWDDNNLLIDSSIAYSNDGGFRAGTCYEYNVFNILTRTKLNLKEQPLIAMEQAIRKISIDKNDFYSRFKQLANICKKYSGNFVFLWHNNNFHTPEWKEFAANYKELIKAISDEKKN